MPTATFFNLPEEKRETLLEAIRDELARVPFEQVSINKIVQAAGIPRGSFYQYFSDKRDMLDYILSDYQGQVFALVRKSLQATGGDIFQMFADILDFALDFVTQQKINRFCKNVFSDVKLNAGLFSTDSKEGMTALLIQEMIRYVDKERLNLQGPEDFLHMVELLAATTRDAIVEIFMDITHYQSARHSFFNKLTLLKRGFLKP